MRARVAQDFAYLRHELMPLPIAHRGGSKRWPENTLFAFERAMELGIDTIETDVHRTRDGHLVLFHDPALERTTNGRGFVASKTLREIKELDAGYRFSDGEGFPFRSQGIRVPTLHEALDLDVQLNLEIKPTDRETVWDLLRVIHDRQCHDRVLVASSHDVQTRRFRACTNRVCTSAGKRGIMRFYAAVRSGVHLGTYPFQALQVPLTYGDILVTTAKFVREAQARGIRVHVWTIDDREHMEHLRDLGVDAIMSDLPDVLVDVLGAPSPLLSS